MKIQIIDRAKWQAEFKPESIPAEIWSWQFDADKLPDLTKPEYGYLVEGIEMGIMESLAGYQSGRLWHLAKGRQHFEIGLTGRNRGGQMEIEINPDDQLITVLGYINFGPIVEGDVVAGRPVFTIVPKSVL